MADNNARITGTIAWFNGILGRAKDTNGTLYKIHINSFRPEYRETARTILRPGNKISFSPARIQSPSSVKDRAVDIEIVECSPIPGPTGLNIGYWIELRGQRCSACGEQFKTSHSWCPACGAQMHEKNIYDTLVRRLVHVDNQDEITISRDEYTGAQWSAICGLFGADPETAKGLNIAHAVVLTE